MIEEALTGVRLALMALYGTLLWRVIFYSWHVTDQPAAVRQRGWKWWRAGLVSLCVCVIGAYSPMDILRANEMITQETRMLMSLTGSLINAICAVCMLVGLDVATGRRARALPFYLAMIAVAVIWVIVRE